MFWEKEPGLCFNCWNNKRVWSLQQLCEDKECYNYKPTDFYLTVIGRDFLYENIVFDIGSKKQIETYEFYNMNQNSIIDFTRRYNKIKLKYIINRIILTLHAKMS